MGNDSSSDLSSGLPPRSKMIHEQEPDWPALFKNEISKVTCNMEPYQAEAEAFETVLVAWRYFHWTPVEVDGRPMRRPAPATDGIIALAQLNIMPPRSEMRDLPRGGPLYQESN